MTKDFIDPYVSIEICKSKISENDKLRNFYNKLHKLRESDYEFYKYIQELIHENNLEII
jgi:hypothetical protein